MSGTHQLVLPLPEGYACNAKDAQSFFLYDTSQSTADGDPSQSSNASTGLPHYPQLERYLDHLCAFMRRTRLIQRHPHKFFDYVRGAEWQKSAFHLDGCPVTESEVGDTLELCQGFSSLIQRDILRDLPGLLKDGPPLDAGVPTCVTDFYKETRELMLSRHRRPQSDSSRFTLLKNNEKAYAAAAKAAASMDQSGKHKAKLERVLSYSMGPKKQHEVGIMRATVADLISCCNACRMEGVCSSNSNASGEAVETVINIGEGKGYVSRALAVCDAVQVIGLDCNPAHKEKAAERFEWIAENSIGSLKPGQRGADGLNLMYEPCGHVASVTCMVSESVDWKHLLKGHVRTIADGASLNAAECDRGDLVGSATCTAASAAAPSATSAESSGLALSEHDGTVAFRRAKAKCRLCGTVIRASCATSVIKHASRHINTLPSTLSEKEGASGNDNSMRTMQQGAPQLPPRSRAEAQQWCETLPQAAYVSRLLEAYFVSFPDTAVLSSTVTPRKGATSVITPPNEMSHFFELTWVARGYRVEVLLPTRTDRVAGSTTGALAASEEERWSWKRCVATVVGYDEGSGRHQLLADVGIRKENYTLYRCSSAASLNFSEGTTGVLITAAAAAEVAQAVVNYNGEPQPDAGAWGRAQRCIVLRVLPLVAARCPAVRVPSLSNTVHIGLHTCGDLGSNICRLFAKSGAPGLLLVSCCWHMLTETGFPLSHALRSRGMTVDKVSLLLATQPLDMWGTASAEGHRSSAKILFFRSLLGVMWRQLETKWSSSGEHEKCCGACQGKGAFVEHQAAVQCSTGCVFAPMPHLEPPFLRRVTRVKEVVTFAEFVSEVCNEYIYAATAKESEYTWHASVCAQCRIEQEAYIQDQIVKQGIASHIWEEYGKLHFASFLGLTVLRTWMCHLVESLFLLDRAVFLHEELSALPAPHAGTAVSLVPLFDGSLSPRLYGILVRR